MNFIRELATLLRCIWFHPANRGHKMTAIGRFIAWQASKRILARPVIIKVRDRRFMAYPDSPYSSLVIYNQLPDWDELGLLRRILRPDDTFVDIGANVGFYSVFASSLVGPAGRIHSIEPNPGNLKVLENQKALNALAYWTIHPCAVGAQTGTVRFSAETRDTGSVNNDAGESGSNLVVPCRTLDSLLGETTQAVHSQICKIDVEGYELEVLQGAKALIAQKAVWLWVFENNPTALLANGASSRQLLTFFRTAGYHLYRYSEDRIELKPFEAAEAPEFCNLLACADVAKLRVRLEESGLGFDGPAQH